MIIERWTENPKRAIRITPITSPGLLEGFEFPLYESGKRILYTSKRQTEIDQRNPSQGRVYTTERLVEALEVVVKDSKARRERVHATAQVNLLQLDQELTPMQSAGYACLTLQTLFVSPFDEQLQELMIVDDPRVQRAHEICMCLQARDSTFEQYERNPAVKVDNLERKKVWNKIARGGLVGVRPTPNGIDQIDGPEGELEASLAEINRYQSTTYRDIDEENDKGEAEDPALGGDPSNMDQGYHYNRQLTDEEHSTQLAIEETRLKAQSWYDSINRMVTTTDKDTQGNLITMPWYEWTYTQA